MILVVDDHADTRQTLIRLFKSHGLPAVGAASGNEAMAMIQAQRPRVVLLDFNMPGMNGLEFLSMLRGSEEWKDVPVIMFSAMSSEVEEQARKLGVDEYIRKCAFDWPSLIERLKRYFDVEAVYHPAQQFGTPETGRADAAL